MDWTLETPLHSIVNVLPADTVPAPVVVLRPARLAYRLSNRRRRHRSRRPTTRLFKILPALRPATHVLRVVYHGLKRFVSFTLTASPPIPIAPCLRGDGLMAVQAHRLH
ncbi:hypothetical protein DFH06DRAFT_1319314 [Mycena polygramma]|nr:hypothetical protein DFH06DRAFT_1319314 [Mycena polygramma]